MADTRPEVGRKITFLGVKTLTRLGNLGLACMPEGTEGRIIHVGENGMIGALLMAGRGLLRIGLMPEEYRVEADDPWMQVPFAKLRGGDAFMTTSGRGLVKLNRVIFQRVGGELLERNAVYVAKGICVFVKPDEDVFFVEERLTVERIGGKIENG